MKKSFFYSVAAILALAACSKEVDVKVPTGETVTIIASVDQTKSTEDHATFSWADDEQISVGTSDEEYVAFDVTDAANGLFSHTFTGETPNLLVAVSPAQAASAEFAGADAYEVELPAIYNNYEPSKGVTNALMIGVPDPNTPNRFLFRHAAALLKITYANVPVGTSGFVLKADKPLNNGWSGEKVLLGGTGVADIEIVNTNSSLVQENPTIVNLKDAVTEANTTLTFYVPVPTGEYSNLRVSLTGVDGEIASSIKTMARTGYSPLTLARGDVFSFPTITLEEQEEPIGDKYVKVESPLSDYTGNYLIIYEPETDLEDYLAFNGGLASLDVPGNVHSVAVVDGAVDFSEDTYGCQFKIAKIGDSGNYSIQTNNGKYIGVTSNSNGLSVSESNAYPHSLSIDNDKHAVISAVFEGSTMTMRYNAASNQNRFRYYKSGQQPVALYKLNGRLDVNFPTLTAEDVTIPANATEAVVEFSTNQSWTVTASSDFLDQDISISGTKDDTQSVTLRFKAANNGFEDRTVTVHITAGTLTKDVIVTQKGIVPTITVSPTSATVAANATSSSFNVNSNFSWRVMSITVNGETAPTGFSATVDPDNETKVNVVFPSNVLDITTNTRSIVVTVGEEGFKTAVYTITQEGNVIQGGENEVVDVITLATTGVASGSSSYSSWSEKQSNSNAIYAGNSAGGNESIQLRSNNSNSGVVSTASGGKVKSVSVVWNSNTTSGRTIDIYGSNKAYTSAADLYDTSKQGTKLGSITFNSSTPLTVSGDYKYIGIRSNSGALYLTQISITWDTAPDGGEGGDEDGFSYTLTPTKNSKNSAYAQTFDVTIDNMIWNAPGNQNIDGAWRIGGSSITSVKRVIYAKSAMGGDVNSVVISTSGISRSSVIVNGISVTAHTSAELAASENDANAISFSTQDSFEFGTNTNKEISFAKDGSGSCEGKFFRIVFTITNENTNNGGLNLTKIVFSE